MEPSRRRRPPDPYTPPLLALMVAVVIGLFLREIQLAYVPSNAPPPTVYQGRSTGRSVPLFRHFKGKKGRVPSPAPVPAPGKFGVPEYIRAQSAPHWWGGP